MANHLKNGKEQYYHNERERERERVEEWREGERGKRKGGGGEEGGGESGAYLLAQMLG